MVANLRPTGNGFLCRQDAHEGSVSRAIAAAVRASGIGKHATLQELLSHKSVETTMVYLHVMNKGIGVKNPLDDR